MGAVPHYSEANVEPGRCFRFVHDAAKATPVLVRAYRVPRTVQDGLGGCTRSGRARSTLATWPRRGRSEDLMPSTFSVGFAEVAAVLSLAAVYMAQPTVLGVPVACMLKKSELGFEAAGTMRTRGASVCEVSCETTKFRNRPSRVLKPVRTGQPLAWAEDPPTLTRYHLPKVNDVTTHQ